LKNSEPSLVYWIGNRLYLNITNQCSNQCWFCFRNFKQGIGDFNLKLTAEPDPATVIAALKEALPTRRWNEAVFCGFGEPTSRLDVLLEVTCWMKLNQPSLPIRLDTNGQGYALNRGIDVVKELKAAGVGFASVSLNGYDEQTYTENCRPGCGGTFEAVLHFVKRAKHEFPVEVTAIRMTEVDIARVKAVAEGLGVPFRVREYIPCFW
jgi:GTP 3',8-cyclase